MRCSRGVNIFGFDAADRQRTRSSVTPPICRMIGSSTDSIRGRVPAANRDVEFGT